ncbi:CBS domain-containing protein, partial [Streptomyces sp. NPDC127112]|uniref:CBS domain-containing protein n=1 Tax=Streptomyces sp. NPDC127112 TaxID=3345364 RepID=UPI0036250BC4
MKHIKVGDLMTGDVVSVTPDTPFKEVAKLLTQYDISGLPVLDEEDRVVGVVSQTDLLARTARAPEPSGEADTPAGPPTAGGAMSAPAITIRAEDTAADAARGQDPPGHKGRPRAGDAVTQVGNRPHPGHRGP